MTPGQAAFEKFIEIAQLTPISFVYWENLSDEGQAMWEQVARAAINEYNVNLCNDV